MLKMVGNSGQLSLGKKYAGRYYQVEHQRDAVRPGQHGLVDGLNAGGRFWRG